jgi:PBSX family phage terminase large subunit
MVSAHVSIIPEFTAKIEAYSLEKVFDVKQNEITNKLTGSTILFKGLRTSTGNNTAALKSLANVTTWVIEELEDLQDENIFDTIDLSIRHKTLQNRVIAIMNPSYKAHFAYKRFFKNVEYNFNGTIDGVTYIFTSYLDNIHNLPNSFIEQAERMKSNNLLRYQHLFLGQWLDDADGLLWNRAMINRQRTDTKPDLQRIVIAVDPATTATMQSDETGIAVVGKAANGQAYIIADLSGRYTPNEWGVVVADAVKTYKADCVVAESNQGGQMVEAVLRQHDKLTRIKLIHARKGKMLRAEPVYSLYEQGKVWHVGTFPILENQMVTFNPEANDKSPDRVDAMVYGVTEVTQSTTPSFWFK